MPEVHSEHLWKHPSVEFWQTLTSWVETFQRHQGTCNTNVQALKGQMFRLIIKAAVRVETMWVLVDGLHYHMAWKLKHFA